MLANFTEWIPVVLKLAVVFFVIAAIVSIIVDKEPPPPRKPDVGRRVR